MKIGILGDIHGNIEALKAACQIVFRQTMIRDANVTLRACT